MNSEARNTSRIIIGHAGTGKTTRLIVILRELLENIDIGEHNIIPIISAMHGARRRLAQRVNEIQTDIRQQSGKRLKFSVETIDSLALDIANRGRELIGIQEPLIPFSREFIENPILGTVEVGDICNLATKVLSSIQGKRMIVNTFPFVIIDEFQDCRDGKLNFVKALNNCIPVFLAADDFQDINIGDYNTHAISWANETMNVDDLGTESKRTSESYILNTATFLRGINAVNGPFVNVCTFNAPGLAAWEIMKYVRFNNWRGSTVILTFSDDWYVKEVLKSLNKERETNERMQTLSFRWVGTGKEENISIIEEINKYCTSEDLGLHMKPPNDCSLLLESALEKCQLMSRRQSKSTFKKNLLIEIALQMVHTKRTFCTYYPSRVSMKIHTAKNQEWDTVFILWSKRQFSARTTEEYKKRILYNAVTRSKKNCLILAYDPQNNILNTDSFLRFT